MLRRMENTLVDRLYYNRTKSISFIPQSTKNAKIDNPIMAKGSEEDLYKYSRINPNELNVNNSLQAENKKTFMEKTKNLKLTDYNGYLEKLSSYENKKSYKKKY